jgi:hypothetical protein
MKLTTFSTQLTLLCCLFLLTTAMSCPDYWEDETYINEGYTDEKSVTANKIGDIELRSYNNCGDAPLVITDNRCPATCYRLHVIPILAYGGTPRNSIEPHVIDVHITTLTDFDAEHSAGSDVTELFHRPKSSYTGIGVPIEYVDEGEYYTLLLTTYPAVGNYQFRVTFTFPGGNLIARDTELLNFY